MRQIVCEDCKKRYDYDKEEFCPRCGAFNQPVKTWTTDSQGNVRRVDGVNEQNHAGSFVHSEVHKEKAVRKITGMDWSGKTKNTRQSSPPRQSAPQKKPSGQKQNNARQGLKVLFWVLAVMVFFNLLLPLLAALLHLF